MAHARAPAYALSRDRLVETRLVDYVLCHELVHLVHGDHGSEFWGVLGRLMRDYDEPRRELRRVGARFVW